MDIEKARAAHLLYIRRADLRASILTMRSRIDAFPNGSGTTNLTIPTSWLPDIIKIAERELDNVNEQMEKL